MLEHGPNAMADKVPQVGWADGLQPFSGQNRIQRSHQIGRGVHQRAIEIENDRHTGRSVQQDFLPRCGNREGPSASQIIALKAWQNRHAYGGIRPEKSEGKVSLADRAQWLLAVMAKNRDILRLGANL